MSDGCKHCYAETLVTGRMGEANLWGPATAGRRRRRTAVNNWKKVVSWNNAAKKAGVADRLFCASLADVFEDHPDCNAARPDLWNLIRETPYLWWQLLTKRPENIRGMLPDDWGEFGYPNVWLGTSIEDMRVVDRVVHLREVPAAVHFISYEPALGSLNGLPMFGVDWVIYGGESGPGYRQDDPQWARDMRRKCQDWGTAFYYKQSAAPRTETGITLDGEQVEEYPIPRGLYQKLYAFTNIDVDVRNAYMMRCARDRETFSQTVAREAVEGLRQRLEPATRIAKRNPNEPQLEL